VSVLAHYFEGDGLQTTLISLIREHTEKVRSPRALWVPFDFGRPLGIPGDADFQRRVVLAALALLDAGEGESPVLVDYPEEAPLVEEETGWTCPINLKPPAEIDQRGPLLAALDDELAKLAPWYDRAMDKQGGTTVGASAIAIEDIPSFITGFLEGEPPANPRPETPLADMLVFACDDLRAYYLEAVSAQPGRAVGAETVDWFWGETTAARVLWALRSLCRDSDDAAMREAMDRFAPDHIVTRLSAGEVSSWRE
jgi:hypothetical protein